MMGWIDEAIDNVRTGYDLRGVGVRLGLFHPHGGLGRCVECALRHPTLPADDGRLQLYSRGATQRWRCFRCRSSGTVFDLIALGVLGRMPTSSTDWERVREWAMHHGLIAERDGS